MNCSEKKQFDSKASALKFLRKVLGRVKKHIDQHPYICDVCHYWHLATEFDHPNKKTAN